MKKESGFPLMGKDEKEDSKESSSENWTACKSSGLEVFFSRLLRAGKPIILDIGAVSGSSIQYMASLGCKVYADNIFEMGFTGKLPYESLFFNGVLAWESIDMLDFPTAEEFLGEVKRVLKPDGVAFFVASSREKDRAEGTLKFRIKNQATFEYAYHEDILLKKNFYSNRDLMKIVSGFEMISFNLLKKGGREIVVRKGKESSNCS